MQSLKAYKLNKIKKIYRTLFGVISVSKIKDDVVLILPLYENKLVKNIYEKRMYNKLEKILYNFNIDTVVLSNELKNNGIKNELYSQNMNILNGKTLFEIMIMETLEYISNKQNKKISDMEVTILSNNISKLLIENIIIIANNVKVVNIVTQNIDKFKKVEERIRERFGIVIRVMNNKRKSLAQSKIIINMDFPEEIINKYNINQFAIIININEKIRIYSKKFSGINISDYCIKVDSKELLDLDRMLKTYETKELYESILLKFSDLYSIRKKIEEDKAKITILYGNNAVISEKEYINLKQMY